MLTNEEKRADLQTGNFTSRGLHIASVDKLYGEGIHVKHETELNGRNLMKIIENQNPGCSQIITCDIHKMLEYGLCDIIIPLTTGFCSQQHVEEDRIIMLVNHALGNILFYLHDYTTWRG